jgi:hypothetical protein
MKKYLAIAFLLLSAPAVAQEQDTAARLESWISMIVSNRVKKDWTPQLYAAPSTAASLGVIAGMTVTSDPAMKEKVLQLRNVEAFPDVDQMKQPITVPANSVMAEQRW